MKLTKKVWVPVAVIVGVGVLAFTFQDSIRARLLAPKDSSIPAGTADVTERTAPTIVASKLDTPWGIAFLPNDELLVTERNGTVQRIGASGQRYPIDGVIEAGEGGLLGIALHPDVARNNFVYLYSTYTSEQGLRNRVERYTYGSDRLSGRTVIINDIPAAANHDGGALAFGPDGKLYITTGDAAVPELAQDQESLAGKILRLNDDGSVPDDNPFDNAVYSYGHRNPQGLAWDSEGRLWSTEHGPSGTATGRDELNLVERGANYGWPVITGTETQEGMRTSIAQSGDDDTWAPGGVAYYDGALYFTGLRGQTLYKATIGTASTTPTVTLNRYFTETYGRLRAAVVHEEKLYISTSNRDGRGSPTAEDDRIISIVPTILK